MTFTMDSISPDGDPCSLLLTDREIASQSLAEREDAARDVLVAISRGLDCADDALTNLENDGLLGPAITRVCNDLADVVSSVAREIGDQTEEERRRFAAACLEDARSELDLLESIKAEGACSGDFSPKPVPAGAGVDDCAAPAADRRSSSVAAAEKVAAMDEADIYDAVNAAQAILLDVEEVLRSVGQEEAEEIAEVGIAVAKMFVWSLQSIQGSVTPQLLAGTEEERRVTVGGDSVGIEILDEGEGDDAQEGSATSSTSFRRSAPPLSGQDRRVRVLWPPIGPAVASAGRWGAESASKNPIVSVALAMALWPAALVAAFIGAPIVAVDCALQQGYDANKDRPIVEAAERGAANLYQVGKLYFLCTKLVVKQSLRVGGRQIERRGGLGAVATDIGGMALDRALHPIETVGMAWDGLMWGAGTFLDTAKFVKDVATGEVAVGGVPADMH